MSVRVDILDSFYAHLSNITVANGYNYSWVALKSTGNGNYTASDNFADANFSIGLEESSQGKGQSLYYLTAPIYCKAYFEYSQIDVKDNDYYIEQVKSNMVEDLRKAFGLHTNAMCQAGLNELNYIQEIEPEEVTGYTVAIQLEFQIRWYDGRI